MKARPDAGEKGGIERRLFHLGAGLILPVLALFLPFPWLAGVAGSAFLFFLSWEAFRFLWPRANQWSARYLVPLLKSQERFQITGATYLVAASLIVILLFSRPVVVASLLFLALGDPAASLVGMRWGKRRLGRKSLEGSLACLLVCSVLAFLLSIVYNQPNIVALLAGALAATGAELVPWPDDNLTIPLAGAVVMALL